MTDLATTQNQVANREPSTGELLASVNTAIQTGNLTTASMDFMERLCALREREEKRNAEREFAAAFVKLQQEIPTIQGARPIPDKHGNVKFRYANFDDIDAIVRPICLRNGFTYAFHESAIGEGRVTVVMTLTHSGGHTRQVPYSCRIGSGPPGANESQADGSGHTYAQRGAIESGLALRIVGAREDAKNIGGPVSAEKAIELSERVHACKADPVKFLEYAGAASFEEIGEADLERVERMLRAKETMRAKVADTSLASKDLF